MFGCKLRYFLTAGLIGGGALIGGMFSLAKITGKGSFRIARIMSFLDPWQDAQGSRLADYTKFICNWIRRAFWSRTSVKVNKNIFIFRNLIMTLYLQLLQKNWGL